MKILELEFNEAEMKEFLQRNTYRIETHSLPGGAMYTGDRSVSWNSNYELALLENDLDYNSDKEYTKVFKEEIDRRLKTMLLGL